MGSVEDSPESCTSSQSGSWVSSGHADHSPQPSLGPADLDLGLDLDSDPLSLMVSTKTPNHTSGRVGIILYTCYRFIIGAMRDQIVSSLVKFIYEATPVSFGCEVSEHISH